MGGVAGAPLPASVGEYTVEVTSLDATPANDINPGDGAARVYEVVIDATSNSGEHVYVKFYDNASPTVGTTDAHMVLKGYKGTKKTYVFPKGKAFATACSVAAVQEKGGGAGTTSPSGTVDVTVILEDV